MSNLKRTPLRILLVDDDEDLLFLLSRAVTRAMPGAHVEVRTNPELALTYLQSHIVDAIVTDNRMPAMDGMTFVRTIRQRDARTPVFMVTSSSHLQKEAVAAGVTHYLPCHELTEVAESLRTLLVDQGHGASADELRVSAP
jgi:two-component system, NtrC family, response regulator GlrR